MRAWPAEMGGWTLGGQNMIWAGGQPVNLEILYGAEQLDIDNLEQPGVPGSLPRDPVVVQTEYEIHYDLDGTVLATGAAASSTMAAFHSNYTKLRQLVGTPSSWGGSSITSVLTPYGGTPVSAQVQGYVSPWETTPGQGQGTILPVTVTIVVPSGVHA